MKKFTYLGILLLFSFQSAAFQLCPVESISEDLKENARTVIRKSILEFDVKNLQQASEKRMVAITFLKSHDSMEDLVIPYSGDQQIKKISVKFLDANGELIRSLNKKEINDYSAISDFSIYEDDRLKHISLKHGTFPYTVIYEYEKNYDAIYTYPIWGAEGFNTAIEHASYEILVPEDQEVLYKLYNSDVQPIEGRKNKKKSYQWTLQDLKAERKVIYHPPTHKIFPLLMTLPHAINIEDYEGSYDDWESFSRFIHELNKGRDQISDELKAKVKSLTANAKNNKEKITILYKFLQSETRYVSVQLGIGGWQTFDAAYVENNKYGDCKALSNFSKSLLKEIGIEAKTATIYSGANTLELNEDFAHPYSNHMILYVPEEDMWLECTSSFSPPGYIGANNADRNCLVIDDDAGGLVRTPKLSNNSLVKKVNLIVKEDGSAIAQIEQIYEGRYQDRLRYKFRTESDKDIKEEFYEQLPISGFTIKDHAFTIDETEPRLSTSSSVEFDKLASKSGKRLFLPINILSKAPSKLKKDPERALEVHFTYDQNEKEITQIEIPENYSIEAVPENSFHLECPFGSYELNFVQDGNLLKITRKYKRHKGTFAASKYEELREFCKEIAKRDNQKIVLVAN